MRLGVAYHDSLKVVITKKEEGKIKISWNPLGWEKYAVKHIYFQFDIMWELKTSNWFINSVDQNHVFLHFVLKDEQIVFKFGTFCA